MAARPRLALLALAGLLAGCRLGPDFAAPAAPATPAYVAAGEAGGPQDAQQVALGERLAENWWTLFRSPQLDALVRQAIAGNHDLAASKATLAQSWETVNATFGGLYPQLDLGGGVSRQEVNLASYGFVGPNPTFNLYTLGPTVNFDLDLFGRTKRQVESQAAQAGADAYRLSAAWLTITGGVATQALQIAALKAQLAALGEIVASDERNLQLVRTAEAAGTGTRVEALSAESQLANDRTLLPPLRQRLDQARHGLALLVGRPPAAWSPPELALADFTLADFTLPARLPVALPSALVHDRPDILAAEAELHAATAEIGVATARMYPDISLSAALSQGAPHVGDLFSGSFTAWSIGTALAAPLFRGGTLSAEKRGAEDAAKAALARYQQVVLKAFVQVADLLQALAHDEELVAEQQRAEAAAQASLDLARLSYSAGNSGILQVLDAQRQFQQARLGSVRAEAQRYLDTVQLFVATAHGWSGAASAEPPPQSAATP
ncbi:MAG: efflux transporter outer membrane subunit [Dongiaceae bacterium]